MFKTPEQLLEAVKFHYEVSDSEISLAPGKSGEFEATLVVKGPRYIPIKIVALPDKVMHGHARVLLYGKLHHKTAKKWTTPILEYLNAGKTIRPSTFGENGTMVQGWNL